MNIVFPVVMVIVIWLTNGETVYRVMEVPPHVVCEIDAQKFEEIYARERDVARVYVACARPDRSDI